MVRIAFFLLVLQAFASGSAVGEYGGGGKFSDAPTVEALRGQGPEGLESAIKAYQIEQYQHAGADPEKLEQLRDQIDQVAAQRHAWISQLYWYTDLEKAKAAAIETGKPILSLRMLGKLTDEFSCANSRFFRTSLYANEAISKVMRDSFVLHWQSVRPVPKVTIDFGDGRKLQRTVTGNSAHYLLDSQGRPLDALPGLYSPQEFQAWLDRVGIWFTTSEQAKHPMSYASAVTLYHQFQRQLLLQRWQNDIQQAGLKPTVARRALQVGKRSSVGEFPAANQAAKVTFAKGRAEGPLMTVFGLNPDQVESKLDDSHWEKIAALHRGDTKLDQRSVNLMRQENPNAFQAGAVAGTKRIVEDPILRVVRNFEESISLDTVRNEYLLHRQIHQWFIDGSALTDVETLNERVYAELFLTPSSDPWLGLVPESTYTGLDRGGLTGPPLSVSRFIVPQPSSRMTKPTK